MTDHQTCQLTQVVRGRASNDLSRKLTKVGERPVIYNAREAQGNIGAHGEWGRRVPLVH